MPYSNFKNLSNDDLKLLANTIRTLSIDMVEKAGSGHPGMPLGIADVLTVLFAKFLKFNPKDAKWINRDRFILSAGHGCAVLYSLFYLLGYEDVSLDDLKNFRQLHSKTAGHPEFGFCNATEVTTGPLGQGVANGVGMAIAENILRERFGEIINHKTFVLAGDGCFMEGISFEAMALVGHLGLSNLIYIYDKNNITIDGKLSLADSTDFPKRFSSAGFNVFECNGHNYNTIEAALNLAINSDNGKPSVIIAETKIGFASPNKEGSEKSHGSPLGATEVLAVKKALKLEGEPFVVKEEALKLWREIGLLSGENQKHWQERLEESPKKNEFSKAISSWNNGEISRVISDIKKGLETKREEKATRQHSATILSKFAESFPNLIGGSADLSESNGAKSKVSNPITKSDFTGNYIHYGIREHAMGAIMNGISLHSNFKSYGATFLVFADYMRPAIRLAALMKIPNIYIFTHDSISLGEDGPTHQPVEHLTSLRIIPNLNVFRPADCVETAESLELAMQSKETPSVLALSRQSVKELTPLRNENFVAKGFYFASEIENSDLTIYASGSEVSLAFEVKAKLLEKGVRASIVSMPSFEMFEKQTEEYKAKILTAKKRVFIEAGILGLLAKYKKEGDFFFGVETFGESGKPKDVLKYFSLDSEIIIKHIL
jgi:transketolase